MRPLHEWDAAYLDELARQDGMADFDLKRDWITPGAVRFRLMGWDAWLEAMVKWALPICLPLAAFLYAAGLVAIVAMSACFPFSNWLLGLILAWVGLFFVFSVPIIAVTYLVFALAIFRFSVGGVRRLGHAACRGKRSTSKPGRGVTRGTWDRWLDGIGE